MLKIDFYPEYDNTDLIAATEEYRSIWKEDGGKIVSSIKKVSGLSLVEEHINALVFEGVSQSNPLLLRASNNYDTKRAVLVHELCHRLTFGNQVRHLSTSEDKSLMIHKKIDLVLYDIWIELYGEKFATKAVEFERGLQPMYGEAWDWALKLSKEERKDRFSDLKRQ